MKMIYRCGWGSVCSFIAAVTCLLVCRFVGIIAATRKEATSVASKWG